MSYQIIDNSIRTQQHYATKAQRNIDAYKFALQKSRSSEVATEFALKVIFGSFLWVIGLVLKSIIFILIKGWSWLSK